MSNFNYILTLLKSANARVKSNDPMASVIQNLDKLNKQIQQLNLPEHDPDSQEDNALRPHKMTEQEFKDLLQNYDELRKSARIAHKQNARDISHQLMDEMMRMINRDLEALHHVKPGQLADYHSMVEDSAHFTADISGKELDRVGGSSSSRFPMSVSDGKGGYVDGYFTADSRLIPDVIAKDAVQEAIRGCAENETLVKALQKLSKGSLDSIAKTLFGDNVTFDNHDQAVKIFTPSFDMTTNMLNSIWGNVLKINEPLMLSDDEAKSLCTMVNKIYSAGFGCAFNKNRAGIKEGGVIGQRNAAMSAVADYLGVPELIARSNQISVLVGKTKEGDPIFKNGTFMEKVEGNTASQLKRLKVDPDVLSVDMNNDAMKKAATNLQVLDFICGNVDRHQGNYFFKSEIINHVLTFTGLVGIDNDASFGTIDLEHDTHCLRAPSNMGFISEAMADKVKSMKKDDLAQLLAGFGIRNSEISSAWDRVQSLQKAIAQNKIKVVAEGEWKDVSFQDMDKANTKETKFMGIGTICLNASQDVVGSYSLKKVYSDKIFKGLTDEYLMAHPECKDASAIPEEEKNKMLDRTAYAADKIMKAKYDLNGDKDPLNSFFEQAVEAINKQENLNLDYEYMDDATPDQAQMCEDKAEDLYLENVGKQALAEFAKKQQKSSVAEQDEDERSEIDPDNISDANAINSDDEDDKQMAPLTGRAARLADVQNKLEDIKATFELTLAEHGMSKECRKMHDSMDKLLNMAKALKEKELKDPDHFSAEDWDAFEAQVRDTLDNTCYYISKKSANPRHQYGKDRLDAAHELRSETLSALQMAQDEITMRKEFPEYARLKEQELNKARTKQMNKTVQKNKESSQKEMESSSSSLMV